jgi:hypothetical protein
MSQVRGYSPQYVERLVKPPYVCVAYPQLGATQRQGYYDLNQTLPAPGNINGNQNLHHLAISVVAVETLARERGWTSPEEHESQRAHIEALSLEKAQLEAELEGMRARFEAIDVIESEGFRARKKPGRKTQDKAAA